MDFLPVNEVIEKLIDYRGKTPKKTDSGVRLITAKVIKNGTITNTNHEYIAAEDYDSWMRRGLPKKGDCLVTTEAPLGEVAQLKTSEKIALAQRVILLRAKPDVLDSDYLLYALQSDYVQAGLKARSTGTTVAGIKQSELRQVLLPVPELGVQQEIGKILSAYDNLIENNNRRIAILEEMAQSLYREWFVKFRYPGHENAKFIDSPLGKIPDGWEVKPIGELAEYVNRGIAPKYSEDSEEVVINQKCIRNFKIDLSIARRHINKVPDEKRVRYGDVLINSTGVGTLGRVAQVLFKPEKITVDTHVTVVRPVPKVPVEFFGSCLEYLQSHFERLGEGATGQTELKRQLISETLVVVPGSDYMDLYAETVRANRTMTPLLLRKNENLRQQRDMQLPRLISGKIDLNGRD